ncbi:MAG: outer membrane lipoprotein carrier protein LolA, partial [Bacteroidales bacterium]|nr:outer membrane lipoprotein carrier protein LolA [Bacteroidales bacterium]
MSLSKRRLFPLAAWAMALCLALTARPLPAQTQTATDVKAQNVMDALLNWLHSYKSLTANFRYSVSQSGGKPQSGEGHILLKGRAYRMQIDGTVFLCDGKQLTVYQPDLEEATLQAYDPTQDELNPFLWLANYEKRFRSKYIRLQNQNGGLQDVVDLIPTQAAPFQKIRLFVQHNTHQLDGMELYDTQDRIYSYKISDFVYNPTVKP